jgi:ADP-ribosylglycohydrolase
MTDSHEARLARARVALEGLSVGDAFGDRFFGISQQTALTVFETRTPSYEKPWWRYTDDTNMALSIYENLFCG